MAQIQSIQANPKGRAVKQSHANLATDVTLDVWDVADLFPKHGIFRAPT